MNIQPNAPTVEEGEGVVFSTPQSVSVTPSTSTVQKRTVHSQLKLEAVNDEYTADPPISNGMDILQAEINEICP